jgi:hypothetical protein
LKLTTGAYPIKLIFLCFLFFGVKLGHFIINFFLYETNAKAFHQKTEKKSLLTKKKSFIGSATGLRSFDLFSMTSHQRRKTKYLTLLLSFADAPELKSIEIVFLFFVIQVF